MLAALGIVTCSQLCERRDVLYHLYSPSSFEHFMQISLGIGSTRVERYAVNSVHCDSVLSSLVTEHAKIVMLCCIHFLH